MILFGVLCFFSFQRIKDNPRSVIWSDSEGYYKYLPGLFILKDFHKLDAGSVFPYYNQKGEYVDKYTCGVAYLEAPFFLLTHVLSNHNIDSVEPYYYSRSYALGIALGGVTYGFLGLLLTVYNLRRRYNIRISVVSTILIFLGTNLYHYVTKEMGTSHVYSFFLFSLFILLIDKFNRKPSFLSAAGMGLVIGIIGLIRPTNLIICFLPLFWDIITKDEFGKRLLFYRRNIKYLIVIVPFIALTFLPQLIYWREMTGNFIYYSYQDEGFKFWNNPKILEVLFDIQNGLFLYSPLYIVPVIILVLRSIKFNLESRFMLLLFIIITYIYASWWAWWFGGAFGHRCYVEFTAIFVFPLAYFINYLIENLTFYKKQFVFIFFGLLCFYSIRLSYLYTSIGGPWDGLDWRWNLDKYFWILHNFF